MDLDTIDANEKIKVNNDLSCFDVAHTSDGTVKVLFMLPPQVERLLGRKLNSNFPCQETLEILEFDVKRTQKNTP